MTTILVVEDERIIRENINDLLTYDGYTVLEAKNGREGLEIAQKHFPDLVISDIMMPEMSGYEMLKNLREAKETETIPFIFLTAKSDRHDWRKGAELGADDYLIKPFRSHELLGAVKARLARQQKVIAQTEERMDELRESIATSLPHEFRTPLTVIEGYSELLLDAYRGMDPDDMEHMLKAIHDSTKRLSHIIQNYLMYSQLVVAKSQPDVVEQMKNQYTVTPHSIISYICEQRAKKYDRPADLELNLDPLDDTKALSISETYLMKVVEETVDNAFKFSDSESAVRVGAAEKDGRYEIRIINHPKSDFSPEDLQHIGAYIQFDRKQREQQGLGLGLALSRLITELCGGEFDVHHQDETEIEVTISFVITTPQLYAVDGS